jgi:PAS domain S-box-containing protein
VLSYAFFAGLWILLSDRAMGLLLSDPAALVQASMLKGWFFVAVTTLLLYVLVGRLVSQLDAAHQRELDYEHAQKQPPPMLVAIADASDEAIFAKDMAGRYLLFNNAAARLVGKSAEEVLGQDDRALFPPEQAELIMANERHIRESGQTRTIEVVRDTFQGQRVLLATKGPLRGADGRIFGTYGISRDITERKQAEAQLREREHQLGAIVDNSPSALSLKHPDGRYALANPNLQRIHHLSEAEIIGKTDFDLYPEATARSFRDNDLLVLKSMARHSIEEIVPVDGVAHIYLSHLFPVLDNEGKAEFICRISLDITERKIADENIKRRNEELEHFSHAAIDRELRMIALKREVNELACVAGRPAPYDTSFADGPGAKKAS